MNTSGSAPIAVAANDATSPQGLVRGVSACWRRLTWWTVLGLMAILGLASGVVFTTRFDPLGKAQAAYDKRDFRTALRAAQDHLKRWPGDRRAALMAARCLTRLGGARQAEEYYRRCGPLELADLQDRAYSLVLMGQPEQAAGIYYEIIQQWPEEVLALKRLAAVLMELKQWKAALLLSERLIRIPEGEVAGHTLAGIGFHVSRHPAEAVASFEQVLQVDPELKQMPLPHALFWDHLALDLLALGRAREARGYLVRALAKGEEAGLRELLGVTYEREGSLDQAEACWRQALTRDPDNTDALLDLGRLALGRGRFDEAVRLLERAVERSPHSIDPVYNLSRVYRLKGDVAKAEHYEATAAQLRRSQPQHGGMGEMLADDDESTSTAQARHESIR
jgi:tetratricopeptide (TPR) repeat protein